MINRLLKLVSWFLMEEALEQLRPEHCPYCGVWDRQIALRRAEYCGDPSCAIDDIMYNVNDRPRNETWDLIVKIKDGAATSIKNWPRK